MALNAKRDRTTRQEQPMTDEQGRRAAYEESGSDAGDWAAPTRPATGRRPRLATMVSVRFSPEEIDRVRAAAEADGMTVSAYLRAAALARCTPVAEQRSVFIPYTQPSESFGGEPQRLTFLQSSAGALA